LPFPSFLCILIMVSEKVEAGASPANRFLEDNMRGFVWVFVIVLLALVAYGSGQQSAAMPPQSEAPMFAIPFVNQAPVPDIPFVDIPLVDQSLTDMAADAFGGAVQPYMAVLPANTPAAQGGGVGFMFSPPVTQVFETVGTADVDSALAQLGLVREDVIVVCVGEAEKWRDCAIQDGVRTGWTVRRSGGQLVVKSSF
jgi:hypothetical protein